MTNPAPPSTNASTAITFFGVAAGSQISTILLYIIQTYGGHPLPESVTDAITGLVAGLVAFLIHRYNNAN